MKQVDYEFRWSGVVKIKMYKHMFQAMANERNILMNGILQ